MRMLYVDELVVVDQYNRQPNSKSLSLSLFICTRRNSIFFLVSPYSLFYILAFFCFCCSRQQVAVEFSLFSSVRAAGPSDDS